MGQFAGRIMSGTIVDNTTNESRFVRVRLPGIDDGLPDDKLPWSGIARPLFRGAGQSTGIWSRPRVGSKVLGMFDAGDRDSFIVMFELENPASSVGWEENEWGVQDEEGTYIKVTVGETLEVFHAGTTVSIASDGAVHIDSPANVTVTGESLTFEGPATFTDDVQMNTTLIVNDEATIGGIAFTPHTHPGVQSGGSSTGAPQ